jgi:hypothetical protein
MQETFLGWETGSSDFSGVRGPRSGSSYRSLFNMPGVHVLEVTWRERSGRIAAGLRLLVETDAAEMGCPGCEVIATRGRAPTPQAARHPCDRRPGRAGVWPQRRYRCLEPACQVGGFSEDHLLAGPRA